MLHLVVNVHVFVLLLISTIWNKDGIITTEGLRLILQVFLEEFSPELLVRLKLGLLFCIIIFLLTLFGHSLLISRTVSFLALFIDFHIFVLFVLPVNPITFMLAHLHM